jgi:hypothetical protein
MLADLGNGEFLRREAASRQAAQKARAKIRAMTPEQRAAKKAADAKIKAALNQYRTLSALVKKPFSAIGKLHPLEEKMRQAVWARDWDAVFTLLPPKWWGPQTGTEKGSPGKYSFRYVKQKAYPPNYLARAAAASRSRRTVHINGGFERLTKREIDALPMVTVPKFKPWQKQDLINWTMSKYYTVQPGWTCSEAQRMAGVEYYWKYTNAWRRQYPSTNPRHVFPMYPGGGARKQRYGCVKPKKSLWDKIKKPLAIVVGVVAAVWLGPIVIGKIAGAGAAEVAGGTAAAGASSGGAAAAGIVGAGAKAGAVTAITTKGAVAAAITTKATVTGAAALATVKTVSTASMIAGAAEAGTLFSKAQTLTTWVNRARSVDAIIKGELPPPPIGISGSNFTEWAVDLAKKEVGDIIKEEIGERAGEYLSKKAQEKAEKEAEAMMRAEIEKMQRELAALVSAQTPVMPAPEIDAPVRDKIIEMQNIERQRAQQNMLLLAGGAAVAFVALG